MHPSDNSLDGGVDVGAVIAILRQRWKPIILLPMLSMLIGIIYLHIVPQQYESQMRVIPAASSAGDGLAGKLSQFGGLAAVAGVSLPESGGSSSFKLYVEALHSRDVADVLARDPVLLQGVFKREWDAGAGRWHAPRGFIYDFGRTVKSVIGLPNLPWQHPGAARLQKWMTDAVGVEQNSKSQVVTVKVLSEDAEFAVFFLNRLNLVVDNMLRERALLRTDDYIRYLTARMPMITLVEQRVAISQALGEQERIKMVASSTRPYAGELFEHPAASDRPVTPKPAKVLAIAAVLGLLAGLAWAFVIRLRPRSSALPTL